MQSDRAASDAGMSLVSVGPGTAAVRMTVTTRHANGHGFCHGGVLFTLADTAFGVACNSHGPRTVAAGGDIVFARPVTVGDEVLATATERTRFGRSGVYDVSLTRGAEVVAEFRGRSRVVGMDQLGDEIPMEAR